MSARCAYLAIVVALASCRDPAVLREWLASWEAARACMITNPEYGPDSETAYAVSSFLKDNYCPEERVRLVGIPDSDRSSIPNWEELRKDLDAVVGGEVRAEVIDKLDARAASLREAARLPPIVRAPRRTPVPLDAEAPYSEPDTDSWPGPGMLTIAMPSRAWAADAGGDVLTISEHGGAPIKVKLPGAYWPSRAMDRGDARVVTLRRMGNREGFAVAHSHDRGRTWKVEQSVDNLPITRSSQDPVTGTIYAIVESLGHTYLHRFDNVEPWTFPTRIEIPRFNDWSECHSDNVLYVLAALGTRLLRVDGAASVLDTGSSALELVACDRRSALLWSQSDLVLTRCRDGECIKVYKSAQSRAQRFESAATLREDGTWVLATVSGNIVGVWREGHDAPAFFRLREAGELLKLRASNSTVELVLEIDGKLYAVALPKL